MKTFFVLFFLWPQVASAATTTFSWQQCVDMARKNSGDLKAAEANLEAVRAREGVSRGSLLPQISGKIEAAETGTTPDAPPSNTTTTRAYGAGLDANLNLFNGFQDVGALAQSRRNTDAARADLQAAKAKLSYDLKSGFEGLIFAQKYAVLMKEIIKRRQDNLRMVELRFENGRENKGSVLQARAYLAEARYDELRARNAKLVSLRQLATAIGWDGQLDFAVTDNVPTVEPTGVEPDFRAVALRTPERLQAVAKEEASQEGIRNARGAFFPTLAVSGGVGRQGPDFFPRDSAWSIGLKLSFPFFNGGKDYYAYESAVSQFSVSSSTRASIDRQLLAKLAQAYSGYIEAVVRLKVDESFREALQLRAEIGRNKYNNGLLNFDDWDVIENDLIRRELAYLSSARDRVNAEASWEQAQGIGVIP